VSAEQERWLVLLRHGPAGKRLEGAGDDARPLTAEGRRKTREAVRGLAHLMPKPDAIWTSPLVRARQTAELAAREFGLVGKGLLDVPALTHGHPVEDALRALAGWKGRVLLCAGHASDLDVLIARLVRAPAPVTALKKAGAAGLTLVSTTPIRAELRWLLPPRILRALG
jgi:phosphohistidine phosphatase